MAQETSRWTAEMDASLINIVNGSPNTPVSWQELVGLFMKTPRAIYRRIAAQVPSISEETADMYKTWRTPEAEAAMKYWHIVPKKRSAAKKKAPTKSARPKVDKLWRIHFADGSRMSVTGNLNRTIEKVNPALFEDVVSIVRVEDGRLKA